MADSAIDASSSANLFWKLFFAPEKAVEWEAFAPRFEEFLRIDSSFPNYNEFMACVKEMICNEDPNTKEPLVSSENFGNFVHWFSPLDTTHTTSFVNNVLSLMAA